jgi:CRISPR/Cas system-associated protein endoribonuclease Cas2
MQLLLVEYELPVKTAVRGQALAAFACLSFLVEARSMHEYSCYSKYILI